MKIYSKIHRVKRAWTSSVVELMLSLL